ncbi:MAG: rRNA maturation RNase YbeY [Amaricoccus sp.]|uniref:rRNA maturation RNase YbeY n=1 Tax=Amaricoccus sp. TaxID=1872485 RepID=UPI0039E2D39B
MPDAEPLVEVILEDPRWHEAGLEPMAERAARAALSAVGRDPDRHEIALLACSDARIAGLNADFRGKPKPTNVLSWPDHDGAVPEPEGAGAGERLFLGDIAIAFDTCAREAEEGGLPFADHVSHLVVHGVLHLLGHDHEDDAEAEAMEAIETNVLASMGVPNPYSREERPSGASPG